MITANEAQEILREFLGQKYQYDRAKQAYQYVKNFTGWKSSEDRDRILASLPTKETTKANLFFWSEPTETSCGWIFYEFLGRYGDDIDPTSAHMVNLWTGEVVDIGRNCWNEITIDACLRLYMDSLPEEYRTLAVKRIDRLPFTPVRFYPSFVDLNTEYLKGLEPFSIIVEFDLAYFSKIEMPLPKLIVEDLFYGPKHEFLDICRLGAVTKIKRLSPEEIDANPWFVVGKKYCEYRVVLPHEEKRIGARVKLDITHATHTSAEMVKELETINFPIAHLSIDTYRCIDK